jgi:cytochrome c
MMRFVIAASAATLLSCTSAPHASTNAPQEQSAPHENTSPAHASTSSPSVSVAPSSGASTPAAGAAVASSPIASAALRPTKPEPREPGLWARFYFVGEPMEKLCLLVQNQTPNLSVTLPTLELVSAKDDKSPLAGDMQYTFITLVEGFLEIADAGKYVLRLRSDDGSQLRLDGRLVIDHDGLHAPKDKDEEIELAAGEHALEIAHFQSYGGFELSLSWKRPGAKDFEIVPSSALMCRKGEMHITSPGPKKIIHPLERGRPGDGLPLESVHPSYDLMTVRPEGFEPKVGGMDWLSDGRLVISTWDPIGCVYILDGVRGDDRSKITVKRFASGLAEPLGVCVVNDRIFVLQKQELTELIDRDKDGVADEYRCVCSGWNVSANFHEFAFGLVFKDGTFYANLATAIVPGGKSVEPQIAGRGSTIAISLEKGTFEVVAHGERTPNGIGFGTDGEIFLTDNQGDWLPASKLLHLKPGAFYGSRSVLLDKAKDLAVTPPVLWLPQNEIGNSPSTPALIPEGNGPYSGEMCHGDVTYGGIQRDFIERVDGEYQGCVFRWTQGLEAGINRITFGPDHALYVGGIGSTGNWGQEGKQKFGLQRLKYNGKPCFDLLAVRAKSDGFEVELTEALADDEVLDADDWQVEQWRYVPTSDYGGPNIDQETLLVRNVAVAEDKKHIDLWIDGLKEGHVVHVRSVGALTSQSGRKLWTSEAWYTLNKIPKKLVRAAPLAPAITQNALTPAEVKNGWRLLFDGRSTQGWRGYKQSAMPKGWEAIDGALACTNGGGDIVTEDEYQDFELALEWKISPGGNSGIMTRVGEEHDAPWQTGPEMQILDNAHHDDGRNPMTSAGACYALYAPKWDLTRPVGSWNRARILVHGDHTEYWLNGEKVVEYELESADWKTRVAVSKFASMPDFAKRAKGRIALQDHGDRVSFRNIKIRPIASR